MKTAWVLESAKATLTLYHGTSPELAAQIRQEGLKVPAGVMGKWFMLTDSYDQAVRYSQGAVVTFEVPEDKIWSSGSTGAVLWPGEPHHVYGFDAVAYAPKDGIVPASMVAKVTKTAAHPKAILGERGQVDESQWYLAEPVPVSLLKKLRLHERTRGTGPLTPADLAKPISILWNPWTGRANLGDGNHRVNQALADGVKSLLAVVDVWPDWIRDFDPKVTEPISPYETPRRFETNDVVSPSEAGFPTS